MAADDSLILAGAIELMGPAGGVASTIPVCAGAVFQAQDPDLGAAQPTTDYVGSLLLDGERPFGRRASNRTITMGVRIDATSFSNLAAAREVLCQAIDADEFTLVWTRRQDGDDPQPFPLVLDCFRAHASTVAWGGADGNAINPSGLMTITFDALPYGRSQQPVLVPLASPVTGGPPPPPDPVVLDDFSTVSGTGWSQSSSQFIVGPHSAHWSPSGEFGFGEVPEYDSSFTAADLTGLTSLSVWAGFGSDFYYFWNRGPVTFSFTLTDSSDATLAFSVTAGIHVGNGAGSPAWKLITAPIPAGRGGFDYTSVAGCKVRATNISPGELAWTDLYLDALTAIPPSEVTPVSIRGHVYTLRGVLGTARTPISVQAQQRFTT